MTNTPAQNAAFPIEGYSNGISIRDYFAAKAMQGLCSNHEIWSSNHDDKLAEMAYRAADSMLRAREAS